MLFTLWAHRRMSRAIVAILDVNMSRLADVAHGNILTVRAKRILAAGVQTRTLARRCFANYGRHPRLLRLFLVF